MKLRQKPSAPKKLLLIPLSAALLLAPFIKQISVTTGVQAATSSELRSQSAQLQDQINANKVKVEELRQQAQTIQTKIDGLNLDIQNATDQINLINLKLQELQLQLEKTQAELDRQKALLKASLRALYQKNGASSVELLMASDNFSDYISSQEYLDRLQSSVKDSAEKVLDLKQQIQSEKDQQQELLKEQENQKTLLTTKQNEQQMLLDQTKGDQAKFQSLVANLRAQQAEVNRQLFAQVQLESGDGNNGYYPYANYAFSMTPGGCGPGEGPDRWMYCTRQCVSYAAWAVERSGRRAPYGYGNARNWVNVAPQAWQFDSPKAGDVGVSTAGTYGHVVYVEAVYGNGTMRISQYNAQLTGQYSEATVSVNKFNKYIRFP